MNSEPSRDTVRLACLPHCHPERHRASFNRQVYTATARAPSAHARIAVSAFYGFAARGLPLNGRGARRTRGDRRQKGDAPGARQRCPRSPHGASDSPATPRAQEAPRDEGARARSAEPGPRCGSACARSKRRGIRAVIGAQKGKSAEVAAIPIHAGFGAPMVARLGRDKARNGLSRTLGNAAQRPKSARARRRLAPAASTSPVQGSLGPASSSLFGPPLTRCGSTRVRW